jgi:hypothetical protein
VPQLYAEQMTQQPQTLSSDSRFSGGFTIAHTAPCLRSTYPSFSKRNNTVIMRALTSSQCSISSSTVCPRFLSCNRLLPRTTSSASRREYSKRGTVFHHSSTPFDNIFGCGPLSRGQDFLPVRSSVDESPLALGDPERTEIGHALIENVRKDTVGESNHAKEDARRDDRQECELHPQVA